MLLLLLLLLLPIDFSLFFFQKANINIYDSRIIIFLFLFWIVPFHLDDAFFFPEKDVNQMKRTTRTSTEYEIHRWRASLKNKKLKSKKHFLTIRWCHHHPSIRLLMYYFGKTMLYKDVNYYIWNMCNILSLLALVL